MTEYDIAALSVAVIFYIVILGFALIYYIFDSTVTAVYAKKHGVKYYGVAFLPIGREYILGSLAQQYNPKKKSRRCFMGLSIAFYIIMFLFIGFVTSLVFAAAYVPDEEAVILPFALAMVAAELVFIGMSFAYAIYSYIIAYRIFAFKAGEAGVIWLIVDIFINAFVMPIFMLVYMNKPGKSVHAQNS